MAGKRSLAERIRAQQERHRARSRVLRVPVAVVGFGVVLAGIAMLALPGPGWAAIVLGLAILALEFTWAERILERAVDRLEKAREQAAGASPLAKTVGLAVALAGLAALAAAALLIDVPLLPV